MTELLLKYFRTKQREVQTERIYDTQCPFCSMQCKKQVIEQSVVTRKKYRVLGKDNPASHGRLCIKGMNAHQHAMHPDRLQYPLLKVNGKFEQIPWDKAMRIMKEKFESIQAMHGFNALSVYGGGSLTNETSYLLGKFARVALKTKYIDYNGRFCMSSAAAAANHAFGIDRGMTNGLDDIPLAKCIVLAGTNIAECQPTLLPYFEKAKENGSFIIVIDPRETATAKMADLHLKPKPGTDAALVNGILQVLLTEKEMDLSFIKQRTRGFAELKAFVETIKLDDIEELTGVPSSQIRKAAILFGKAATGMVFTARGVEQHTDGYQTVRNLINILLVTGKIGKAGCGYGAITGQGNGQGGREHGLKADQLPGYRSIENPEHRRYIADVWNIDETDLPGKGVSAYEMMEKIGRGEIRGMLLMGSNPIVSNPNAEFVRSALEKLDFLVAADLFISETAELADLILPVSSYLENEGTMTNLEGRVMHRPCAMPSTGLVKHDWQILCEISRLFGKEEYFSFSSPEEIFNELREASKGGIADYYGIDYKRLKNGDGVLWPCPDSAHPGTDRLFENSFATKDQKAVMIPVPSGAEAEKKRPNKKYPLYLTTGRVVSHYLTGVQTRKSASLAARNVESFAEIHPETANRYGIRNKTLIKIESIKGSIVVRSHLTEAIRKDTVFVPFHWADNQNVNLLVSDQLDPVCGMPGFKITAVNIRRLE